jgi:meiotically up-regulated gene 157 (Mug157) protein
MDYIHYNIQLAYSIFHLHLRIEDWEGAEWLTELKEIHKLLGQESDFKDYMHERAEHTAASPPFI